MSHVVKVDLVIRDLDALEEACGDLGVELVRGKTTFRSFFGPAPCEHCITLAGATDIHEIGLVARTDGEAGWELQLDPWKETASGFGRMEERVGEDCIRLRRAYAERAAVRKMRALGYVVANRRSKSRTPGEPAHLVFRRRSALEVRR